MEREQSNLSQPTLLSLRLPDLWVSSCGSRPHRVILRSSSKCDSKAASREHGCPGAAGALGRRAHWASRLLSSSSLSSQLSPWSRGVGVVSRGPERGRGSLPREPLNSGSYQKGRELPTQGVGFLTWFSLPFHKYEHQRAGEGIFSSRGQNGENISLSPALFQPPTSPTSEKKKKSSMCTEGKGKRGERVLFSFTIKKSQQDVLQSYKYTFSNSKYLY